MKKLLRQCMLDSVDDDLEGRVLHKLVKNCLRKRRVLKDRLLRKAVVLKKELGQIQCGFDRTTILSIFPHVS
jgi:hypothetical protein